MSDYHEPADEMKPEDRNFSRALRSMKEEIEAIDWYNQRISAASDKSLQKILAHNRDEEMEHAAMLLEWLRRNMKGWDEPLREYLFTEKPITEIEEE
jgi:hypothetical protein